MSDKSISDYIECEKHDWHDLGSCPYCELFAKDKRIAELESALRYIAEYAHPDFPADDLAGELDRAEKIWLQFQNVASFALKGQDDA